MSASILYHCFGLVKINYLKTEFIKGKVIFWIELKDKECAHCHSPRVIQRGRKIRQLKTVPIGGKPVLINLNLRRLKCQNCNYLALESYHQIAEARKHFTRKLAAFIITLSHCMTTKDIAGLMHMHWNTIWQIISGHLTKYIPSTRDLRKLKWIGIDEISYGKNHRYLTLVVDHVTGRIVHVARNRNEDSLYRFFKRLRKLKAPIEVITGDMWRPYLSVIRTFYPKSHIVYDKFHIIANLNRSLDELRRTEYHKQDNKTVKVIKGIRFLLLKRPEKLTAHAREKLDLLFTINHKLALGYELKEMLYQLWQNHSVDDAAIFLSRWCQMAVASAITPFKKFAKSLMRHKDAVLNYFRFKFTNARLEGINNKIKTLQKQTYGMRNPDHLFIRIYSLHLKKYALIG